MQRFKREKIMSDSYYKDTKEAIQAFNSTTSELSGILTDDIINGFENLIGEVEMILDMYNSNLEDLEIANELLVKHNIES
jgi:hypothetical protein